MSILGIDLGTTNSAVALVNRHGTAELLANRDGEYITPSVVFFEDGHPIVGSTAKRSAALDPESVVQFVKRQMGNSDWSFITAGGESYSAEEISALILRRLKEDAEAITGQRFTRAVVSVPAYFQDAERQATKDAANMAGLDVARIVNEPTAAALAFAVNADHEGHIVVYDLGGGTFDVTVLKLGSGELKVLATGGDRCLGGIDWDNELMVHLNDRFAQATGTDLVEQPETEQALRDKAEAAKLALSSMSSAKVVLSAGAQTETITVTRAEFDELTADLLDRTRVILEEVVEESGLRWPEVSKVLLVGGSTKMPAVATLIERVAGQPPSREVHPDEVVALGAAVQAAMIDSQTGPSLSGAGEVGMIEWEPVDATAHSLGLKLVNLDDGSWYNHVVVDKGSSLPCSVKTVIRTVDDAQTGWKIEVTQGEDRDLRYVSIVGEGHVQFDQPKPARHPVDAEVRYDVDGLVHVDVFDGLTRHFFGELDIRRESNLTARELTQARHRISGMTLD